MAGLSTTGDAYSLYLLSRIDAKELTPAAAEGHRRVTSHLENHCRPDPQKHEIGPLLYRASVADLRCHPLESLFAQWLIETLKAQLAQPELRAHLIKPYAQPPVPAGLDGQAWRASAGRIKAYIDRILDAKYDVPVSKDKRPSR